VKRLIKLGLTTPDRAALALEIKIKDIIRNSDKFTGIVEKDRTIVPSINISSGEYACSCEDYIYRKVFCKHLVALFLRLNEDDKERFLKSFLESRKSVPSKIGRPLSSGCEALDKLMGGGVPSGILLGIYGESKIGKTWLAYQLSSAISSQLKKPSLYIDTEGFSFDKLREYFSRRFEGSEVHITEARDIYRLLEFFGIKLVLKSSEGGRIDAIIELSSKPFESPAYRLIRDLEYKVLVIDSLTEVLKRFIPVPPQQNFPARAAVINVLFGRLEEIVSPLNIVGIIVHHQSKNPMMEHSWGKPYGGQNIMYNLKYLLQILPPRKADIETYGERCRRILRAYWPGLEQEEVVVVLEKDYGYK